MLTVVSRSMARHRCSLCHSETFCESLVVFVNYIVFGDDGVEPEVGLHNIPFLPIQ